MDLTLWHPDGVLHSPLYGRPVLGKGIGRLSEIAKEHAPDSVWQLLDWTARGVDWFRLREGKIDTAPLRAAAEGLTLSPVIALPA